MNRPTKPRRNLAPSGGLLLVMLLLSPLASADCVVLLHGLGRTAKSMEPLERAFIDQGYSVANVDYPSRTAKIARLARIAVGQGLAMCSVEKEQQVHFVTHSLGGILVRAYLADEPLPNLGRVVMLAPPNQGSEVVDRLGKMPGFRWWNGPAGRQLGTGPDSIPNRLGPVDFPVGVIAGTRTINLLLSQFLPNPDDGKVSVSRTRVDGMTDFLTVPASHPFIMRDKTVLQQAVFFVRSGRFDREEADET